MSAFRPPIQRYATERIFAAREIHYLSGARDYDLEIVSEIVFTVEAGLSFFHTHGMGMGVILLFASTAVSTLVARRWLRSGLNALIGLSFLFPIGYLAYSAFILLYGKDAGIALAEQWLLIPFGSSAILGLVLASGAAAVAFVNERRVRRRATPRPEEEGEGWRRPPLAVVFASALLIFVAEIGGASMGRWTREINALARTWVLGAAPAHGLVGLRDVDEEIIDEALVKLDGGLRLFHLHAEGMGLVIFAGALVISTFVASPRLRRALYGLLTVGGFGFPFGYLLWSRVIPPLGVDRARAVAETAVLIPFGSAALAALWLLTLLLARDLFRAWRRRVGSRSPSEGAEPAPERGWAALPPVGLVLTSMLLLVLAEVGGAAMVKLKIPIERINRQQIEARPQVHGLVGVRQVDGEIVDRTLARADFALRLFHLHAEGMGLVIFAGGMTIRTFLASRWLRMALYAMLAVGGFFYPFGYLAWSLLIPRLGVERSKEVAEYVAWIPFGGAALAAVGVLAVVLALRLVRARRLAVARLFAPLWAIALAAASAGPARAHHVGVFVPKDTDITINFKQIKASAQAGRFDVAVKSFDDGILHDTMEQYEKVLPRGLEDGLRAALKSKDLPGAELRLSIFLAFLTKERVRDAVKRLKDPGLSPEERWGQARKILNAAWRYYNLADFVIMQRDAKASAVIRMGFEDAQSYLGGMMVDPMWAAGSQPCNPRPAKLPGEAAGAPPSNVRPVVPDERKARAALALMERTLEEAIREGALVARKGGAKEFLPSR
ncbi:MAG: hypothetical protein HY725_12255 [Candidatus Rokubacteria bacterium]|nr:hypothetical protein [Candidatus Rokubacteria bacterium]